MNLFERNALQANRLMILIADPHTPSHKYKGQTQTIRTPIKLYPHQSAKYIISGLCTCAVLQYVSENGDIHPQLPHNYFYSAHETNPPNQQIVDISFPISL